MDQLYFSDKIKASSNMEDLLPPSINETTFPSPNNSHVFGNTSLESYKIDLDLYRKYAQNRSVSDTAHYGLIIAYTCMIVFGTIGNLLVIIAIASNKSK